MPIDLMNGKLKGFLGMLYEQLKSLYTLKTKAILYKKQLYNEELFYALIISIEAQQLIYEKERNDLIIKKS